VSALQRRVEQLEAKRPAEAQKPLEIEVMLICGHGVPVSSFFISDSFKKIPGEFCEHCAAGEPGWGGRRAA
jgi:hypothetical protein